jgi:hypothetical protein
MAYTDTEILIGVLVVAVLLLLYCKSSKNKTDGFRESGLVPLSFSGHREKYTNMPKAGTFQSGFIAGYSYDPYASEGGFNIGPTIDERVPVDGLHEKETRQTPAGSSCKTPARTDVDLKWTPNMEVVPNVYSSDKYMYTSLASSDNDMAYMDMYVRAKTAPPTPGPKNPSVGGVSLALSDFGSERDSMHSNRYI